MTEVTMPVRPDDREWRISLTVRVLQFAAAMAILAVFDKWAIPILAGLVLAYRITTAFVALHKSGRSASP
jgi:hypothetical protein